MTQPGADCIQVDSGLKQVAVARMADHVRRDLPPGERRHTRRATLDKPIDPEPRVRSLLPVEEDGVAGRPLLRQFGKDTFGPRPTVTR